jgi:hypothetical protein
MESHVLVCHEKHGSETEEMHLERGEKRRMGLREGRRERGKEREREKERHRGEREDGERRRMESWRADELNLLSSIECVLYRMCSLSHESVKLRYASGRRTTKC